MFLHTNTFTRKYFYADILWHTVTGAFTQILYTFFSQTDFFSHTHTRAGSFTGMFFYIIRCFTQIYFYTEILLHTDAITNRGSLAKERMCTRSFQIRTFLRRHTSTWLPAADTHFARKSSASRCQFAISPQLLMIETHFVPKGGTSTNKITISPFFNRIKCNSIYAKSSICKKP